MGCGDVEKDSYDNCDDSLAFNSEKSTTFNSNNIFFTYISARGDAQNGEIVTDMIKLDDFELKNYSFGLRYNTTYKFGQLGLG